MKLNPPPARMPSPDDPRLQAARRKHMAALMAQAKVEHQMRQEAREHILKTGTVPRNLRAYIADYLDDSGPIMDADGVEGHEALFASQGKL